MKTVVNMQPKDPSLATEEVHEIQKVVSNATGTSKEEHSFAVPLFP